MINILYIFLIKSIIFNYLSTNFNDLSTIFNIYAILNYECIKF